LANATHEERRSQPAAMTFILRGKRVKQTGSLWVVALRRLGTKWRLTACAWAKGTPDT
jgi:hypothetical protein